MHNFTECQMKKLDIGFQANDLPTDLELMSECLHELGNMSKGIFNTPPWDNCNKNEAAHQLNTMVQIVKECARRNGIKLNIDR